MNTFDEITNLVKQGKVIHWKSNLYKLQDSSIGIHSAKMTRALTFVIY